MCSKSEHLPTDNSIRHNRGKEVHALEHKYRRKEWENKNMCLEHESRNGDHDDDDDDETKC